MVRALHIGNRRYVIHQLKLLVHTFKALADVTRVRLLVALRERELCVCELCDALALTQSTASTHLQVLREAGLVRTRKEGKWIYYALEPGRQPLLDSAFRFFTTDLQAHTTLRRDARRLAQRLAEREDGACCRGFEQVCCPPKPKRPRRA